MYVCIYVCMYVYVAVVLQNYKITDQKTHRKNVKCKIINYKITKLQGLGTHRQNLK